MNLRKMMTPPTESQIQESLNRPLYLIFDGKMYEIMDQEPGRFDCKNCDAHANRIPDPRYMNGGICPDNDKETVWNCVKGGDVQTLKFVQNV